MDGVFCSPLWFQSPLLLAPGHSISGGQMKQWAGRTEGGWHMDITPRACRELVL